MSFLNYHVGTLDYGSKLSLKFQLGYCTTFGYNGLREIVFSPFIAWAAAAWKLEIRVPLWRQRNVAPSINTDPDCTVASFAGPLDSPDKLIFG